MISTDPVHHTFGFHIPLNNFLMSAEQRSTVEDTLGCSQSARGMLQSAAGCFMNQSCKDSNTHITSVHNIGLHTTFTLNYSKDEREWCFKIRGMVPDNWSHVIGEYSCLHACLKELKERE